MLIFNARNIVRINKEIKKYNFDSFPFFYVPKGDSELINLNENINKFLKFLTWKLYKGKNIRKFIEVRKSSNT